jgi:hypothetical protein
VFLGFAHISIVQMFYCSPFSTLIRLIGLILTDFDRRDAETQSFRATPFFVPLCLCGNIFIQRFNPPRRTKINCSNIQVLKVAYLPDPGRDKLVFWFFLR